MKRDISRLALIAALGTAPAIAPVSTARAQEAENLGTIVLSATRTATERARTGLSVSVVEREELERSGNVRLSDYLATLPGISVAQNGPMGAQTALTIRGASARYTAVFVDGIRVDNPSDIATAFDFGALLTSDIARVEVLRGSQSALWGGSAVAGVINISTLGAEEPGLTQQIAVEAGSFGTASLRYSLGYKGERTETSFSVTRLHSDGYSSFDTDPRNSALEADSLDLTRLSFGISHRLNDQLRIGFTGFAQEAENEYDDWRRDARGNYQIRREYGARLFATYETGATSHQFEATRYRISRDDVTPSLFSEFVGSRTGFSYQGTSEISDALTLVYGAETQQEKASFSSLPDGSDNRMTGLFAQALWSPADTLDLTFALRRDENSDFGSEISGRFTLAWQASDALTLRGAASNGWLPPSLYQKFGDPANTIIANTALTPETSRSLELGADYAMGPGLSLGVTLFEIRTENAITYQSCPYDPVTYACAPGTSNVYENVTGETHRKGVELTAEAALNDRLNLGLSYTYTEAKDPLGARLTRVPRHNLALRLSADLGERLSGSVMLQHVADRAEEYGDIYRDYTLVNVGLGYRLSETTDVSFRVENLFDEEYQILPGYGTSGRAAYLGLSHRF